MPRRQRPQYKRTARFDRTAFRPDMERLTYAKIPESECHPWATSVIDTLSPAAKKVYSLLITLAMVGKRGYPGISVYDDVAARTIKKITGQKCGVKTFRNGRRELCNIGLASRTYWTIPDQHIRNGDRVVVVPGSQRVHLYKNKYCTKQIRITLLTPLGAALFDKKTRLEMYDILSLLPTAEKSSARSQIEDSPHPKDGGSLVLTTNDNVSLKHKSKSVLNFEHSTRQEPLLDTSNDEKEGNPTSPAVSTSSNRQTVEHNHDEKIVDSKNVSAKNERVAERTEEKRYDKSAWVSSGQRGCSVERPAIPKGSGKRKSKVHAQTRLLNVLHQCLNNYPAKTADDIFSRAQVELSLSSYSNWPTIINLPYWISRAPHLTRRELFGYMRARIIPALRYSGPVIPKEPKRYREWTEKRRLSENPPAPSDKLPGFLQKFSQTVGLK